jgi:hypothetical protein
LREPDAIVLERAQEDPLPGRELLVDHAARVVRVRGIDEQERGTLDQHEQDREEHDDSRSYVLQPRLGESQHVDPTPPEGGASGLIRAERAKRMLQWAFGS